MSHLHHVFTGYTKQEGQTLHDIVEITVVDCKNEDEALKKARDIITRPFYRLHKVYECSTCQFQEEQLASQRYMAAFIQNHLRGESDV